MIRKNLKTLLITSVITLLPALAGFILWDKLPEVMPTHWGTGSDANGFSGKLFAVLGMPLILLAIQWLIAFLLNFDHKTAEQNPKALKLVLCLMPGVSCVMGIIVYCIALNLQIKYTVPIAVLLALLFIGLGNYLPKARRSYTFGIKIKPALESEANWNATHRMTGKLWVGCGIALLPSALLPEKYFFICFMGILVVSCLVPVIYSYYYRATHPEDNKTPLQSPFKNDKIPKIITAVLLPIILIVVGILMLTGEVFTEFSNDAFSVSSTYYGKITIDYDDIDTVEYLEAFSGGMRSYGFESAKLCLGNYRNDTFGDYTRYTYTGDIPVVAIKTDGKILVVGGKTAEATKEIFDTLLEKTNR